MIKVWKATILLAGVAAGALAGPAWAQAAPEQPPVSEIAGEDEIIVTAQKIEQPLGDVPATISALGGERIRALGVTDLDELSAYVPGLNIQEQSANNPGIVIRGITSDSGSAQQGPRVTLYYNGVDISRSRGSYQAIYDLERVEVVKGPQATLFGTASAVGAISLISARPQEGVSGELRAGYGNFDQTLVGGFVNVGNDRVAARIAGEWRTRDGYVENLNVAQRDELYAQDQLGLRGSLRLRPSDAVAIDLVGTWDRQRNGGTPFISGTFPTSAGPADPFGPANLSGNPAGAAVLGSDQLGLKRDVWDVNLTATIDLTDRLTITTVNGYRRFDSLETFDADGGPVVYLEFAEDARGEQASHEARFSYADDRWRATFGWNVFHEDGTQAVPFATEEGTFLQCAARVIPNLPCVAPDGTPAASGATAILTGGSLTAVPYASRFENGGRNDSWSMFADGTALAGPLELTAGVRLLIEKRRSRYTATVPRPFLNPTAFSLIPGQTDTGGETYRASRSYAAVLPRINALYRVSDDVNLFATVSKGRRSPVVQLGAARVDGSPAPALQLVPEEVVWNYEAGVKIGTPTVTAAFGVYYQVYDGFQVGVVQPNGQTLTQSVGGASNLGVEAELSVRPTRWLQLFGNIGYIGGGIDEDNRFAPAFSGARFRLQPRWQAAGGFTIDAPLGPRARLFLTPTVTHRSRIFFEVPNNPLLSQGATSLINARGGIAFAENRFEIAAFVRNALDEDFLLDAGNTGGAFGIPTLIPGEPRLFGIELTARY